MELRENRYSDDDWVTVYEVLALTGIPESTIRHWIRTKRLTSRYVEGHRHLRCRVGDLKEIEYPTKIVGKEGKLAKFGDEPVRLYNNGASVRDLAKRYDVAYGSMYDHLKAVGAKFRKRGGSLHRKA